MRFEVEQRFRATPERVLELYTDPDFYQALAGLPKVSAPQVLEHRAEGDRVLLRVRYTFTASLPAAATAVIDPAKLTWVDETWFDLVRGTATTRLLPDHYPDKMQASASATFVAEAQGDTVRRISGDLRVRVLLVGGKVEQAIVSGLREHLVDEEQVAQERLDTDS
ncbi:MAG: DUF2505 domain-containing protein [Acidimicrobiales bacterium]